MPRQSKHTIAVLGIDIGKNTFHLVGLAPEALPAATRSPAYQPAALPRRYGSLCRRPPLKPAAQGTDCVTVWSTVGASIRQWRQLAWRRRSRSSGSSTLSAASARVNQARSRCWLSGKSASSSVTSNR
jgi:hypothetical protein